MYERFFGLNEPPFELTLNPKYLYLSAGHREALSNLEYGLASGKPVTVLTGEAGTGKTTLLSAVLGSDRCRHVACVSLSNPAMTRDEFVEALARRFGLTTGAAESKAVLLDELEGLLRERRRRGAVTALVVDEAQSLSTELLEEIRLLANIETPTEKLLSLVLVGQPELAAKLNDPALRQLKQRVALRCQLLPLDVAETCAFIGARVSIAGGNAPDLFTREAVALIFKYSRGIPRTISVICENALITGFALGRRRIDTAIINEVARDFDLMGADVPSAIAPDPLTTTADLVASAGDEAQERERGVESSAAAEREREMFGAVARARRFALFRN